MKLILFSIWTITIFSSLVHSQGVAKAIMEVIVPCALENGSTPESLVNIDKGDLSSVKELYGCFTDCISRKIGIVTDDDAFHVNVLQDHLRQVVNEDMVTLITEKCSDKIGTKNCAYSGTVYHCLIDTIWGAYFA